MGGYCLEGCRVDLFQMLNWKAAAENREGWRKEIGEATALKINEVSLKIKKIE
jgi:hypothetical protein